MGTLRLLAGLTAIAAMAAAFNLLLITGDTFSQWVTVSFAVAIGAFLVWVALVLVGAIRRQQQEARSLQGVSTAVSTLIFFAICVTLYAFTSRWDQTWDLSEEGRAELAPQTIQVLRGLDRDVEVICIFPGVARRDVDFAREKAKRFLARCQNLSWRIKPSFIEAESSMLQLQQLGITPEQFGQAAGIVVVKAGSAKRYIAVEGVNPKLTEQDFTNALINVVRGAEEKVYFLAGHNEAALDNPSEEKRTRAFNEALRGEGYQVDTLSLDPDAAVIPEDCDVLIIAGPETDLFPAEVGALQEYKKRGGRILVLKDLTPGIVEGVRGMSNLYSWLAADWGVRMMRDCIVAVEGGSGNVEVLMTPSLDGFGEDDETFAAFKGSYNYQHPITRGFAYQMFLGMVSSVQLSNPLPKDVAAEYILRTKENTFAETQIEAFFMNNKVEITADKLKGPIPIAAAATAKTDTPVGDTGRTRDARIVVVGDCNFISDFSMPNNAALRNFALNCMAWLTETEELIADRSGEKVQEPIILTVPQQQAVAWISTLGTLQAVLLAGLVVFLLRRKFS